MCTKNNCCSVSAEWISSLVYLYVYFIHTVFDFISPCLGNLLVKKFFLLLFWNERHIYSVQICLHLWLLHSLLKTKNARNESSVRVAQHSRFSKTCYSKLQGIGKCEPIVKNVVFWIFYRSSVFCKLLWIRESLVPYISQRCLFQAD